MTFESKSRYGAQEFHEDSLDPLPIVERLLAELDEELFDSPDEEHTQVAVSRGTVSLTVETSGLLILDDLSWITGSDADQPIPSRFLRANSRRQVAHALCAVAEGRFEEVLLLPWSDFEAQPPLGASLFGRSGRS